MEFKKFKQQNMQQHYMSQQYPKTMMKQNLMKETSSPNVYQRLSATKRNKLAFSQILDGTSKYDHKKSSSSSMAPGDYHQYLDQKNNSAEDIQQNNDSRQVAFFTEPETRNGAYQKTDKDEIVIQDYHQQLENADRNFELQKNKQQAEQQGDQNNCQNPEQSESENNYTSGQNFFDPNSTQYMKMVDKYFEKNPEYLKHLQGDCICGRCICGKCKCPYRNIPVDYKRGMQTLYQADFQKHKNLEQLPQITMDFHSQVHNNLEQIKCCSTTQNDFRPHDVKEPVYHKGPLTKYSEQPFIGSSNYQNNYVDWKLSQPEKIPNPATSTVVHSVPFIGKTMYMENFQKKPIKDREFEEYIKMKNKSKLSPMNPDFRYLNETNYQFHFQGKNPERSDAYRPFQHTAKNTPSAPDQYRTTFVREFEDKSSIVCPSRIELIELNKKKQQQKYKEYLDKERLKNEKGHITMNSILSQNASRPLKTYA